MTRQKVFMLLAAVMLVAAFAIAVLGPPDMTLGQALLALDHTILARARTAVVGSLSEGWWDRVAVPVLVRPAWLPPAAVGLVFAGCALTMNGPPASQKRRWRS